MNPAAEGKTRDAETKTWKTHQELGAEVFHPEELIRMMEPKDINLALVPWRQWEFKIDVFEGRRTT